MNNFCRVNHEITPKIPSRCTVEQYAKCSNQKNRYAEDQQKLADRILKQSEHIIDVTRTKTEQRKNESDYRIKERLNDIQFLSDEISNQKKEASIEELEIKIYCKRILGAIEFLKNVRDKNSQQCQILKENNDIILINDVVDKEIRHEAEILCKNQKLFENFLTEAIEQSRLLHMVIYALDCELLRKGISFKIDKVNLDLKSNYYAMDLMKKSESTNPLVSTQTEWEEMTHALIQKTSKQISTSKQLRSYINIMLKQTIENVSKQVHRVNEEFQKRISDTRFAKATLENLQKDTLQKINDITTNITDLKTEIAAKEKYIALCRNRLANRAQRPGPELCKDRVQDCLIDELQTLQDTIQYLNQMISESMATQRYLLHTKMIQDEDLNNKIHRLKLDEVDCMTIREAIDFTSF